MGEWKQCRLGDIVHINNDTYSPRENWKWVNYLDTGNLNENNINTLQFIDLSINKLPSRARRKVNIGSILYSTVRPNQRHYGYIKHNVDNLLVSTGFAVIDVDKAKADSKYIYYYLTQNDITEHLQSIAEQAVTTYPSITPTNIENLTIPLPPLPTQRKIASILSALDDKIELNNRMNKNLEEQARAMCKNWILEHFESIKNRPLSEIAYINPDTYSVRQKWNIVNYLDTSNAINGDIYNIQTIKTKDEKLPSRARRIVHEYDIVYSTVRPNQHHFGIICNPVKNMLVSTGFAVVRSKLSYISNTYIYHFLTEIDFIEKMQRIAEQSTSTYPSVKPADIGTCSIPCARNVEMLDISNSLDQIYLSISLKNKKTAI